MLHDLILETRGNGVEGADEPLGREPLVTLLAQVGGDCGSLFGGRLGFALAQGGAYGGETFVLDVTNLDVAVGRISFIRFGS